MSAKWGLGFMSRNRVNYLKKCIDSLFIHNGGYSGKFKDANIIIGDDASTLENIAEIKRYFAMHPVFHFRKQRGMSANIKQIYDVAEAYYEHDYLFFTVNDFYCTREIDFPALLKFMEDNPKVGQIQFVHYKGKLGDPKRERANYNWTEEHHKPKHKRKAAKCGEFIKVGNERIRKTSYSFVNLPAITRLHQCDITRGTVESERRSNESKEQFIQRMELRWVKNWYDTGLENWEIDPTTQPFLGQDIDMTNQTGGIKA